MTKQDYKLIADVIKEHNVNYQHLNGAALARAFADRLAAGNPRFNRDTFLQACGVVAR